jgi:hypothetical protein
MPNAYAMTERIFATACLITVSSGLISRPLILIDLRYTQYAKYPDTLIYAPFFFILVRLYPCSFMTMYAHIYLNTPRQLLIMFNSLNSRIHIRSRLGGSGMNTTISISREQVTDGGPLTTSRLHINTSEDGLAMSSMTKQKRPGIAERVVGFETTSV